MTFGQLNTFLALARAGSVRGAAAALVVTEPAVSAAVGALQRDLGVELVTRQGRGIMLTPAGDTLARYAAEVNERLTQRQVDLAFGDSPSAVSGISGQPFLDYRLVVVAAADHPVADPADETWLLRERGSGTRATVEAFLVAAGIAPRSTLTLGSNGAVKQAVLVGLGITLLSDHAAGAELASGALVPVAMPGAPLERSWFVLRRASGPILPEASAFSAFCRSPEAAAAVLAAIGP